MRNRADYRVAASRSADPFSAVNESLPRQWQPAAGSSTKAAGCGKFGGWGYARACRYRVSHLRCGDFSRGRGRFSAACHAASTAGLRSGRRATAVYLVRDLCRRQWRLWLEFLVRRSGGDSFTGKGGLGGGQGGFNVQINQFVVGLEGDLDWGGVNLGRGGLEFLGSVTVGGVSATASGSNSFDRYGWMVGAGVEYAVTNNLTIKAEYNLLDFGTQTRPFRQTPVAPCSPRDGSFET